MQNRLITCLNETRLLPCQLQGSEFVNQPFHYEVLCHTVDSEILKPNMLPQQLILRFSNELGTMQYICGDVTQTIISKNKQWAKFSLEPKLIKTKHRKNTQTFHNKKSADIIESLLQDHPYIRYHIHPSAHHTAPIPYQAQYEQSDFDHIQQIINSGSIHYCFSHYSNEHRVDFYSLSESSPSKTLPIHTDRMSSEPHIYRWVETHHESANHAAARILIDATSNCLSVKAGDIVCINQQTYYVWKNQLILREYSLAHYHNATASKIENKLQLLPAPFHLPKINNQKTTAAMHYGQAVPRHSSADSHCAFRYPVSSPENGKKNDDSRLQSCPAPVLQIKASKNIGSWFMPSQMESVLVGYIGNCLEKPVILGSLPSENEKPFANNTDGLLFKCANTSAATHQLSFNHSNNAAALAVQSAGHLSFNANSLSLQSQKNMQIEQQSGDLQISSQKGCINLKAKQSIRLQVGSSYILLEPERLTLNAKQIHLNP